MNLHVRHSKFVSLHAQISWQAQHFVNLHASPNLDGEAPRNDGCETVLVNSLLLITNGELAINEKSKLLFLIVHDGATSMTIKAEAKTIEFIAMEAGPGTFVKGA